MTEYLTPIDIANRALQHCGASRIGPQGFAEASKSASEIYFCYGKLRRAELRRNVWRTATRSVALRSIDSNAMMLQPALWSPETTYFAGSIVLDDQNNIWISRLPNNLGQDPQNTPPAWEQYFGPLTVSLWNSAASYFAGELVYTTAGDGKSRVFLSLENSNADDPATATAWDASTTYIKNQVVTFASVAYMSLTDLNTGNQPDQTQPNWDAGTTYTTGNIVAGSNGLVYSSVALVNVGHDPTTDDGTYWAATGALVQWTTSFVGGSGSDKWLQIGGTEFPMGVTLAPMRIFYPLGLQRSIQGSSRNVYRLPSGFLREASQNPNQIAQWLGGPTGITYSDWTFEGDFLVTCDSGPLQFRFVADIGDVRGMDDMFCEALAARIALEVCESLTQSTVKITTIGKVYDEWVNQARTVNGIETGPDVPPDDDYITVRY